MAPDSGSGSVRNSTDFGHLVAGDALPRPGLDVLFGERGARPGDHDGQHRLAPLLGRDADDRHLGYVGVAGDGVLDLGGVDVLAAGHDHVLDPVDQVQVAGRRRGSRRRRCGTTRPGRPRPSPRAGSSTPACSCRPGRTPPRSRRPGRIAAGLVLNGHHRSGHGPPRRAQQVPAPPVLLRSEAGQQAAVLGHPVALEEVEVGEHRQHPLDQRRRHGRGPVGEHLQRRQPLGPEVGMVEEHGHHGRHHHGHRHLVALDDVEHRGGLEDRDEGGLPARRPGRPGCRRARRRGTSASGAGTRTLRPCPSGWPPCRCRASGPGCR